MGNLQDFIAGDYSNIFTKILDYIGWRYEPPIYGSEMRVHCQKHGEDNSASLSINTQDGVWHCFTCGAGGGIVQFYRWLYNVNPGEDQDGLEAFLGIPTNLPTINLAAAQKNLHENQPLLDWLLAERCLTVDTLKEYGIGFDGSRLILPEYDYAGVLRQVIRHLPGFVRDDPNYSGDSRKSFCDVVGVGSRLFPYKAFANVDQHTLEDYEYTELWVFEGWLDAILARQFGLNAVSLTNSGCNGWNKLYDKKFYDKQVYICYDIDKAGEEAARARALHLMLVASSVMLIKLPPDDLPPKGDFTDFIRIKGFEAFMKIKPIQYVQDQADTHVINDLHLSAVSDPIYYKQHIRSAVTVLGKGRTDLVPKKFRIKCKYSAGSECVNCPMAPNELELGISPGFERELIGHISASDPVLLALSDEPDYKVMYAIGKRSGVIRCKGKSKKEACTAYQISIEEVWKLEELVVIPAVDWETGGDAQYVNRMVHYVGTDSLLTNQSYKLTGVSVPSPKDQSACWVCYKSETEREKLSDFLVTDLVKADLCNFQANSPHRAIPLPSESDLNNLDAKYWKHAELVALRTKDAEVYADYRAVTSTIGRDLLFEAVDYVYLSVLSFAFRGTKLRRGHVNAAIVGDTRTAKSETVDTLRDHFTAGHKVDGANLSFAGLVGGVQKIGPKWAVTWGTLPLNNKGLVILDEMHKLSDPTLMGQLSETISSGVIKITKMASEETQAQCRLLMVANPKDELSLDYYQYGCMAIAPIVNNRPEDVARLTFAMCCSSREVTPKEIEAFKMIKKEVKRFTSALCHTRVIWSWSRKCDDIEITPEAEVMISIIAEHQTSKYHESIPLVTPAEQSIKIAQLAVACAVKFVSTDMNFRKVIVRPQHVLHVHQFLHRIYNSDAMSYGDYGKMMRSLDTVSSENLKYVAQLMNLTEVTKNRLLSQDNFKEDMICMLCACNRELAIKIMSAMYNCNCIRRSSNGSTYVKTRAFTDYLKKTKFSEKEFRLSDQPNSIGKVYDFIPKTAEGA